MSHINQEIPREEWTEYLGRISGQEGVQWVRVESISPETGDQPLANRLPLLDLSLETKGADAGTVRIRVGRENREITHRVLDPERIIAELDGDSGALECLEISEHGGAKTLVFFERDVVSEDLSVQR